MSINLIISIGGTGSRIGESFSYLLAAGLIKSNDVFRFYIVDKDVQCGNTGRCVGTLSTYDNFYKIMSQTKKAKVGKNQATLGMLDFNDIMKSMNLSANLDSLKGILEPGYGSVSEMIVNCLYSNEEQNTEMSQGFYGHASLGSAVFEAINTSDAYNESELFRYIKTEKINAGGAELRIIIVGSIFGGTGASIFPNIARSIRDKFCKKPDGTYDEGEMERMRISGVLMLPYFSFPPNESDKNLKVDREDFLRKTVVALRSYDANQKLVKRPGCPNDYIFDSLYLMGSNPFDVTCHVYERGGQDQTHRFHFVDLMGGLAMCDFFNHFNKNEMDQIYVASLSPNAIDHISWMNLPESGETKTRMLAMASFSVYVLTYLRPFMSQDVSDIVKEGLTIQLYGNKQGLKYKLFPEADLDDRNRNLMVEKLETVSSFCVKYLTYLLQIQETRMGAATECCALFNSEAIRSILDAVKQLDIKRSDERKQLFELCRLESVAAADVLTTTTTYHEINELLQDETICKRGICTQPDGISQFLNAVYNCCVRQF